MLLEGTRLGANFMNHMLYRHVWYRHAVFRGMQTGSLAPLILFELHVLWEKVACANLWEQVAWNDSGLKQLSWGSAMVLLIGEGGRGT